MNKLTKIVLIIAVLAGIVFVGYFLKLKKFEVESNVRFQCAQSSRFMISDEKGNNVWYPVSDMYQKCLQERGL